MEFMKSRFERTVRGAATMHGCRASVDVVSESPRADSDPELQALVTEVAEGVDGSTPCSRRRISARARTRRSS